MISCFFISFVVHSCRVIAGIYICTVREWIVTGARTWMDCLLLTHCMRHVSCQHTVIAVAIHCRMARYHWVCQAPYRSWCLLIRWRCPTLSRAVQLQRGRRTSKQPTVAGACRMLKTVFISCRRTAHHYHPRDGRRRGHLSYRRRCRHHRYRYRMPAALAVTIPVAPAHRREIPWTWCFRSIEIRRHRNSPLDPQNLRRNRCLRIWGFLNRWAWCTAVF